MYEIQTGSRNQTRAISMVPKNITLVSIDNMSRQKETLMGNIFGTYIRVDFKVPYIILYKLKVAYHVKRFFLSSHTFWVDFRVLAVVISWQYLFKSFAKNKDSKINSKCVWKTKKHVGKHFLNVSILSGRGSYGLWFLVWGISLKTDICVNRVIDFVDPPNFFFKLTSKMPK